MLWAITEFLRLRCYLYFVVLLSNRRRMMFLITLVTEVSFLSNTVNLWLIWRISCTVLTCRCLTIWSLFLWRTNWEIYQIARIYLIVFENCILMLKYLWVLFLVIKVNWIKTFRTINRPLSILLGSIRIWFSNC